MNEQSIAVKTGFGIDLQKLLRTYLKRWWLIALSVLVLAAGCWGYTAKCITPMYQAGTSIYVNSVNAPQNQQISSISSSMLATSQRLVLTYANMVKSDTVLDKVAEQLGSTSGSDLRKIVKAEQIDETEMLRIVVQHPDPATSAQIANMIADVTLAESRRVIEGSSAKVVDYAKVPTRPASPNLFKNVLLGAMLGACVSVAVLTLTFLLDVRIKEESDLYALFNLPVLGQIPEFDSITDARDKKKTGSAKKGGQ